jgi:hypothetical protein
VASGWSDVDKGKSALLSVECGEGVLASSAGGCVGFADAFLARWRKLFTVSNDLIFHNGHERMLVKRRLSRSKPG